MRKEPNQPGMRYVFRTRVVSVTEEKRIVSGRMIDGNAVLEEEKLGWFILLEGSGEKLYTGPVEPDLKPGQIVKVSIERDK